VNSAFLNQGNMKLYSADIHFWLTRTMLYCHPNYKWHWEIWLFMDEYIITLKKWDSIGRMDISKLATSTTHIYWVPAKGHIFPARILLQGQYLFDRRDKGARGS
jgi:hypothetical protein